MCVINTINMEKAIKTEVVRLHKSIYGVGPGSAYIYISRNVISIKLVQCLTAVEKSLAATDRESVVRIRDLFINGIEKCERLRGVTNADLIDTVVRVHVARDTVYCFLIFDKELVPPIGKSAG